MSAARPSWWRPSWAMPGRFFCGWKSHCGTGAARPHSMASDLVQLQERAS